MVASCASTEYAGADRGAPQRDEDDRCSHESERQHSPVLLLDDPMRTEQKD
jgi:hypothetical protein